MRGGFFYGVGFVLAGKYFAANLCIFFLVEKLPFGYNSKV